MSDSKLRDPYAYMSSALAGLDPETYDFVTKGICERVLAVCKEIHADCYCPHLNTAPMAGVPQYKVYDLNRARIRGSAVVVAYVGIPSVDVGMEIEMAKAFDAHVILLCEEERLSSVSPLVLDSPAVVRTVTLDRANPEKWQRDLAVELRREFNCGTLESFALKAEMSYAEYTKLHEEESREPSLVRRTPMYETILTESEWRQRLNTLRRPAEQSVDLWDPKEYWE